MCPSLLLPVPCGSKASSGGLADPVRPPAAIMNALPQNLANMLALTKRDTDAYSMHSVASRGSDRRKSSRFSLRRMFRRSSVRSARLAKSVSELETRSVSSIQTSGDRDLALMSVSSEESTSTGRGKQLMDCPLCLAQVGWLEWSALMEA